MNAQGNENIPDNEQDLGPAIRYSAKYYDDKYEYRHVILPKHMQMKRLMTEAEWRELGVQQSRGWVHYSIHDPEPHIMLFRRPLNSPYAVPPPKES